VNALDERRTSGGLRSLVSGTLEGIVVRFGVLSADLGGFRERFEAGAFDHSLRYDDIKVQWQHSSQHVLGRVRAGTAKVWADAEALRYRVTPPAAQWARDAVESIRRGDVDQNSFAFLVERPEDQRWETLPDGTSVRTVLRARLREVGPQTDPAYTDTTVAARSRGVRNRATMPTGAVDLRAVAEDRVERDGYTDAELMEFRRWLADAGSRASERRRKSAVHEAGHAVAMERLGVPVRRVGLYAQIFWDGGFSVAGAAWPQVRHTDPRIHAAGPVAERLAFRRFRPEIAEGDFQRIRALGVPVQDACAEVETLLRRHWSSVLAVADALEDRLQITGAEVRSRITV